MNNLYIHTPHLASGYLNDENNPATSIGKPATGTPINFPAQAYAGMLGKLYAVDDADALRLSKTATGTLRIGVYMCVITKAASTAAPAVELGAFWDTSANGGVAKGIVTPDVSATNAAHLAGIYINAPTKGNQCWIQVAGLATLKGAASVASAVAGNLAVLTGLTTNTFDGIADATDYGATAGALKRIIGSWYEAPADGALKLAWLSGAILARYSI